MREFLNHFDDVAICKRIKQLRRLAVAILRRKMEWEEIRNHYERLFLAAKSRGETQETIAARGGLKQNKISELMTNTTRGPVVRTLIKAIEGLDMQPSVFFAQIEAAGKSNVGSATKGSGNSAQAQRSPTEAESYGPSLSIIDAVALSTAILGAVEVLKETIDGAADRVAARLEQTAAPSARKADRRKNRPARTRKTG